MLIHRAIRDDTAFKLTYYFGRQGTIGQDTVVGHSEASLVLKGALQVRSGLCVNGWGRCMPVHGGRAHGASLGLRSPLHMGS